MKSVQAIFLGYDTKAKAYRCYITSQSKVTVSRDVKFLEKERTTFDTGDNVRKPSGLNRKADENSCVEIETNNTVPEPANEEDEIQEEDDIEENDVNNSQPELDVTAGNDDITILSDAHELSTTTEAISTSDEDDKDEQSGADAIHTGHYTITPRRSKRSNKGIPPRRLIDEIGFMVAENREPSTYKEALKCIDNEKWVNAMREEMNSLQKNQTWELVKLPANRKPIGCKWVYKKKSNSNGQGKFKARLVAHGFSQKFGDDYDHVFAPVAKQTTLRILLSVAASKNMHVYHFDAKTAFLNGTLENEIYMKQPPGFAADGQEDLVCFLKKSIYGLKQSARVWHQALHNVLIGAGLVQSANDHGLYSMTRNASTVHILIYVDDILIASNTTGMITHCEQKIQDHFEIQNLGEVRSYLGIGIRKTKKGNFKLSQSSYILRIAKQLGMEKAKVSNIPISVGYGKGESNPMINNEHYRKTIGCLLYVSITTRPDISAAVSILAQKVSSSVKSNG